VIDLVEEFAGPDGRLRFEATVLVSLEHKPEVHSVPSGEDLTDLLLERFHRKVGVTNLLVCKASLQMAAALGPLSGSGPTRL
jgi:hypothetical protein